MDKDVTKRMQEAVDFLYDIPKFTKKNPLVHTKDLMDRLGNPQETFKVIHVAGSNGKGSVCSFLFSILRECGRHTGLFTSPHLTDIRERFLVDGDMVSREEFLEAYRIVRKAADEMREEGESFPTFFEFIFAMGMLLFQMRGVEYAILETGMGGRLDATNVAKRPLVCVITSVSLEHMEYLGDTIEQIAGEKAGIIKPEVPVVFDGSDARVSHIILNRAKELAADSYEIHKNMCKIRETRDGGIDFSFASLYDNETDIFLPFCAPYQMMNAALAVTAFWRIAEQEMADCSKDSLEQKMKNGLARAKWPGRMQEVLPEIWFDGAHNPDGIRAFLEAAKLLCDRDEKRPLLLFSMVRDKDYRQAVREILTDVAWAEICVTGIPSERGLTAAELTDVFEEMQDTTPFCGVQDYKEAFRQMRKKKASGQKLFVTGSLYFIGALLEEIHNA